MNLPGFARITIHPTICEGQPTVRGLRIPVWQVLDWLATGPTEAAVLAAHPELEAADLRVCLAFAAQRLRPLGTTVPTPATAESDEWLRVRQTQWLAEQEFLRQLWERRPGPTGPDSLEPHGPASNQPTPPSRRPPR